MDLFVNDKSRAAIFKKYIIYVDIIRGESGFEPSQKLNSFFGQVGIYEGHERVIGYFEWLFKVNQHLYFNYSENEDFKTHDSISEIDYNFKLENDKEDDFIEENSNDNLTFVAPLSMTFYYGEKKVDFSVLNCFRKHYYFKNQTVVNCLNFLEFKTRNNYGFGKTFFYNLLNKRHTFFSIFKSIFKSNNNIYSLINKGSIDFFKNDNFLFSYYKQMLDYFDLKQSKIFIFKKILQKKNFNVLFNLKKIKWFDSFYILNLVLYKNFLFANKFKHRNLINSSFCFISQLNSIKKKFLKRFKRKKRYKKNITRDFFGKKNIYEKVYNTIEEKKKKRK